MYYKRTLSKSLKEANAFFKVVLLTGPRQVGKTTLLEHIKEPERTYVTLDDMDILMMAQEDPAHFFERFPPPVLIDEVQKAPNLFSYIKAIVDKSKNKGQFWLTGSQQFHLMKNVSESLAGRVAILDLQGLSQSEKAKDETRPAFLPDIPLQTKRPIWSTQQAFDVIAKGSFPQLFDGTPPSMFYSAYVRTYIERDVREILNISNEHAFLKFLKVMAGRTGQVLNYHDISRDIEISVNTVKSWVSVLETSGVIYLLPPYFRNLTKRAIKTPKMYFLDTGLCCYLTGITTGEMALNHPMSGALFETYAVSEILKSYWHNGERPFAYFYRDTQGKEIDLILDKNGKLWPIEIKQTATPNPKMVQSFDVLAAANRGRGALVCTANKLISMGNEVSVVPVSYI
ncbi:MAG: ATP-binding protein [Phycisphaerales bacterium]|nr:ATP-binding protein [Phycisphaerales bacterium]